MRAVLLLALFAGPARADGVYMLGEIGSTVMAGPQIAGHGALRMRMGLGGVHGPWAIEAWTSADIDPRNLAVDCYEPCAAAVEPLVSLVMGGVDVRRDLPLVVGHPTKTLRFFRPRISAFAHGGLRYVHGEDALTGYEGAGIGGGVGFEASLRVWAGYIDFGLDRFELAGPYDSLGGEAFHIVLGQRFGFSL